MNIQIKDEFYKIYANLLDFIFPHACLNCKTIIKKEYSDLNLCHKCYNQINEIVPPYCQVCGKPFTVKIEYHRFCEECKSNEPYFSFLYGTTEYNEISSVLIYAFKYQKKFFLAEKIAEFMIEKVKKNCQEINFTKIDCVVPVPLHFRKKRERGFNQAELLANTIAKKKNLRFQNQLIRTKDTMSQSKLNFYDRKGNVKQAFDVPNPELVRNKNILLIDDVSTTGATVNECSKKLIKSGCKKVQVLVFAKRLKH